MSDDPKRWLDDAGEAPPGARELLAHAQRTKGPDKRTLALSAAALLELGTQPSSAAAAVLAKLASAPAAIASLPLAGKLVVVAATVTLVAVAGVRIAERSTREPVAQRAATTAVERSAAAGRTAHATSVAAPAAVAVPATEPETKLGVAPEPAPAVVPTAEPLAARATRSALLAAQSTRHRARARVPEAVEPVAAASTSEALAESEDELALEVRWLDQARALLAVDPATALARADGHAQRFKGGALAAERELIAIDAMQRLGRVSAARKRADVLLTGQPGSLYRGRLQRVLERDAD
jgi:hypothetical protein